MEFLFTAQLFYLMWKQTNISLKKTIKPKQTQYFSTALELMNMLPFLPDLKNKKQKTNYQQEPLEECFIRKGQPDHLLFQFFQQCLICVQ